MEQRSRFFATAPKGIESLLNTELKEIGAEWTQQTQSGVYFEGDLQLAYRACLWLRTANRVLMPIASFEAKLPENLYDGIKQINWSDHLEPDGTLAVDFFSSRSRIEHSHFGALKVKDAIVDQFREQFDCRPSIDLFRPDIRINLHILKNQATVSLDLSGESLHKRGYRTEGGRAPLKENLAAAILLKAGWKEIAGQGGGLMDPMCGSGTFPIEAALIAADSAPGLLRDYFGFFKWKQHDQQIWDELLAEAEERESVGISNLPPIIGYDADPKAIRNSVANLEKAGLSGFIHFEKRSLSELTPHPKTREKPGIVILNPPYGERMGRQHELRSLYRQLGEKLRQEFPGWHASLFTGNIPLGKDVGLPFSQTDTFYNGTIECRLFTFTGFKKKPVDPKRSPSPDNRVTPQNWTAGPEIEGFTNRLQKNLKRLKKWRLAENIDCFRVYDHDLPEYAVAVDIYHDWIQVQEYQAPSTIDPDLAHSRLNDILSVLPDILNVPAENIFLKVRDRQKGKSQYQRIRSEQVFFEVEEGRCRFHINLTDYLDTGLFLDHRLTRQMIGAMAAGKRFLNLFAYTGTATVHAAMGGALSTMSVDSSQTYLDWARRNLLLNQIKPDRHLFEREDCLNWLKQTDSKYDLIFLDPPTFSNTKSTKSIFDVQRDHPFLIRLTARCLSRGGTLIFSNNLRGFKLDEQIPVTYQVKDISLETLPPDFQRRPNIHHCWMISHKHP
ncbi:bifunctional 23S rRNA (guanine(2069)-N(7))-methyltransferase RlmK/23S rRNA (guanine(2445)-N(2))-methyltransferase RlmL [bacterium]|nr:bifunctional 23S rRNA (guanine(2069)-N(7))-methyltransferase RlmK/23S rRNA (guanine(2445)-N(2))-methyltransferase RlmL [bacterium]